MQQFSSRTFITREVLAGLFLIIDAHIYLVNREVIHASHGIVYVSCPRIPGILLLVDGIEPF